MIIRRILGVCRILFATPLLLMRLLKYVNIGPREGVQNENCEYFNHLRIAQEG